ncbi:MAG: hypothetical protein C0468_05240 [Planctomyces sp.]|nr:hypothetical protein [Planctomyces sp.]
MSQIGGSSRAASVGGLEPPVRRTTGDGQQRPQDQRRQPKQQGHQPPLTQPADSVEIDPRLIKRPPDQDAAAVPAAPDGQLRPRLDIQG